MNIINIGSTTVVKYRTDILESGDYYINPNCFNKVISCTGYDVGCSKGIGNPIVANRILMFGNFYYKELRFENNAVGIPMLSYTTYMFFIVHKIWAEAEESVIRLMWSGYINNFDNVTSVDNMTLLTVNIEDLPPDIWSSIDFSAGFFVHTSEDPSSTYRIRGRFRNSAEAQQEIPDFNSYIQSYMNSHDFATGYVYAEQQWVTTKGNQRVTTGDIRLAYKDINDEFHDFQDYYTTQVITYPMYRTEFLIPFVTQRECNAAECANYQWTTTEINSVRQ